MGQIGAGENSENRVTGILKGLGLSFILAIVVGSFLSSGLLWGYCQTSLLSMQIITGLSIGGIVFDPDTVGNGLLGFRSDCNVSIEIEPPSNGATSKLPPNVRFCQMAPEGGNTEWIEEAEQFSFRLNPHGQTLTNISIRLVPGPAAPPGTNETTRWSSVRIQPSINPSDTHPKDSPIAGESEITYDLGKLSGEEHLYTFNYYQLLAQSRQPGNYLCGQSKQPQIEVKFDGQFKTTHTLLPKDIEVACKSFRDSDGDIKSLSADRSNARGHLKLSMNRFIALRDPDAPRDPADWNPDWCKISPK
jgi:hypothetical protein